MINLPELNLPEFDFKISKDGDEVKILDELRRKKIILTPEEWVRQNFIQFLIQIHKYPRNLIGIEVGLKYNTLVRRADIVVYDKFGKAALIVECKANSISIDQNVFDQVARYNHVLRVPFIIVTNGMQHFCCKINHDGKTYQFLKELPSYQDVNSLNNG